VLWLPRKVRVVGIDAPARTNRLPPSLASTRRKFSADLRPPDGPNQKRYWSWGRTAKHGFPVAGETTTARLMDLSPNVVLWSPMIAVGFGGNIRSPLSLCNCLNPHLVSSS